MTNISLLHGIPLGFTLSFDLTLLWRNPSVSRSSRSRLTERPLENQTNSLSYVYRIYKKKVDELDEHFATLIEEYVANEGSLSDEQAIRMTKEAAEIDPPTASLMPWFSTIEAPSASGTLPVSRPQRQSQHGGGRSFRR